MYRSLRPLGGLLLAAVLALPARAADPAPETAAPPASEAELREQLRSAERGLREARDQLARSARDLARVQAQLGEETPFSRAFGLLADPQRAALGVSIGPGPVEKGKQRGVLVSGVTPGSGAEKAGLQSGDLILSAQGKSLELPADARPGPGQVLRGTLRELEPGTRVALEIERAGKRRKLEVVAQRPEPQLAAEFDIERFGPRGDLLLPRGPEGLAVPMPPLPPMPPPPPMAMGHFMGGPFGGPGLQLARLDEDLAGYFKTREGVLVVKAPPVVEGAPALKSGDVIERINGEPVKSPVEVMDRLFGGGPQQTLTLQVIRQGAALSLQGKLPEPRMRRERRIVGG